MEELLQRYPALESCRKEIREVGDLWIRRFAEGHKLLICGNGGSCADGEHIVGELMKGFLKRRPLSREQKLRMRENCPQLEEGVLDRLQGGLPAISLTGFSALNSAFCNDVDPELVYAQPLMALGQPGDLLLCISTSGNSKNVVAAAKVGKALGMTVLGLTGQGGGKLLEIADLCIRVPETETFKVQELHLPVYHWLCAETEGYFFPE